MYLDGYLRLNTTLIQSELLIIGLILFILNTFKNTIYASEIYLIIYSNYIGIIYLLISYNYIITIIGWELYNITIYLLLLMNPRTTEILLSTSLRYIFISIFATSLFFLYLIYLYSYIGNLSYDS